MRLAAFCAAIATVILALWWELWAIASNRFDLTITYLVTVHGLTWPMVALIVAAAIGLVAHFIYEAR